MCRQLPVRDIFTAGDVVDFAAGFGIDNTAQRINHVIQCDIVADKARGRVHCQLAIATQLAKQFRQKAWGGVGIVKYTGQPRHAAPCRRDGQTQVLPQPLGKIIQMPRGQRIQQQRLGFVGNVDGLAVIQPRGGQIHQAFKRAVFQQFGQQADVGFDRIERAGSVVGGESDGVEHPPQVALKNTGIVSGGCPHRCPRRTECRCQARTDKAGCAENGIVRLLHHRPVVGWCRAGSLWRNSLGLTFLHIKKLALSKRAGSFTATMLKPWSGPSK